MRQICKYFDYFEEHLHSVSITESLKILQPTAGRFRILQQQAEETLAPEDLVKAPEGVDDLDVSAAAEEALKRNLGSRRDGPASSSSSSPPSRQPSWASLLMSRFRRVPMILPRDSTEISIGSDALLSSPNL